MAVREADFQRQRSDFSTSSHAPPLAALAVEMLQVASRGKVEQTVVAPGERSIWQPDSWLMLACWKALAEEGVGEEAMSVAQMQEIRNPLATMQALHQLSLTAKTDVTLRSVVSNELKSMRPKLLGDKLISDATRQTERLVLAAASAVNIADESLALSYLERLDQIDRAWDRVILRTETRTLLADTISAIGLHPLFTYLISTSIRRHEEAGAQFLHQIVSRLKPESPNTKLPRRSARLLRKCVETYQFAPLSSLNSRRLAAIAFGQAGMVNNVLSQLTTMANVQEARRESGYASSVTNPQLLRQVTRPNANPDVDYQAYTLEQAIRAMPVRSLSRDDRIRLANRVAELAVQSDGWTAAGATATLVKLGALKYAVNVVDFISPTDPTRSEGVISLVRALLDADAKEQAKEQTDKALAWLKESAGQNSARATIWGLAEAYLENGDPQMALYLLDQRQEEPSFGSRIRRWMRPGWTDDILRDNRIRFRALLISSDSWTPDVQTLYDDLRRWAPTLLEGETLISFYLDGLLAPLLQAGYVAQVVALLPALSDALAASAGDKHALHIQRASALLRPLADQYNDATLSENGDNPLNVVAELRKFLESVWSYDAGKGLWQTVHGVEGSLRLVCKLDGPEALVAIAEAAANEGGLWVQE